MLRKVESFSISTTTKMTKQGNKQDKDIKSDVSASMKLHRITCANRYGMSESESDADYIARARKATQNKLRKENVALALQELKPIV